MTSFDKNSFMRILKMTTRPKKAGQNVKMTNSNGIRSNESDENFKNMTAEESNAKLGPNTKKNKKKMRNQSKAECSGTKDCTHCLDEREIGLVHLEENQLLWSELRGHVLFMYKIGREQNLWPRIVDRVKYLVDSLCTKDVHQLFIRLERLATEVVKDCLESVERIFSGEIQNSTIAYNYLENIIADYDNYLFAARKMLPMLKSMESHLKKFNVCWIVLHQNLFRIHYLEDRRCEVRAKKAKLLLISDMDIPAQTLNETILKFLQFNETFRAALKHWDESVLKIRKFRESKQIYKNSEHLLTDEWQNFNVQKTKAVAAGTSKPSASASKHTTAETGKKSQSADLKINKTIQENPNANTDNKTLTKTQAKKARRRMKGDHSRQPSADLMPPPPPPRVSDTADASNHQNGEVLEFTEHDMTSEYIPGNFCLREKMKRKVLPPPPASPTPPSSPLKTFGPSMSVDNRDVDALVAFVEGLSINDKNVDIIACENKRRRKKQKKEKQRLKKMQSLLEEDQVAQLIKRSPGVTITMVQGNNSPNNVPNAANAGSKNPPAKQAPAVAKAPRNANAPKASKPAPAAAATHSKPNTSAPSAATNAATKSKETVAAPKPATSDASTETIGSSGSRMVTIRRVTEVNTDEPTVTITLKGPTPDQDQILYRIINGQANYGHLAENVLNKKHGVHSVKDVQLDLKPEVVAPSTAQLTKKQKKKLKRNNDVIIESVPAHTRTTTDTTYVNYYEPLLNVDEVQVTRCDGEPKNSKKAKKASEGAAKAAAATKAKKKNEEKKVAEYSCDTTAKTSSKTQKQKTQQKVAESAPSIASHKQATKPSVKAESAKVTQTSKTQSASAGTDKRTTSKTFANSSLSLPKLFVQRVPTITSNPIVTTVPGARTRPVIKVPANETICKQPVAMNKQPRFPGPQPSMSFRSQTHKAPNVANDTKADNRQVYYVKPKDELADAGQPNAMQHPAKAAAHHQMNGQDMFHDANANNYKLIPENLRLPAGITITKVPPNCNTRKMPYDSAAQRKFNHLDITPETSRMHYEPAMRPRNDLSVDLIIEKQQQLESDFDIRPENRQPPIGTGVPKSCDAPAKFIRAPDGRIIIRSPMARSTTPPLNPITMIRQDLEMGVSPPNVPIPPFWSRNDWWLPGTDNVFAPKDIDLEDNSLDAEERELEAFKRFCQEPVPPQRQEVTHLNVQNIIIKKNHPS